MAQQAQDLEQRLSELQSQIDRLSTSLAAWQQSQERLLPVEHQLSHLTERGTEILDTWTALSQRHAQAVASLEAHVTDWSDVDGRLEQDAARRLQELGRIIENEWRTLRQLHQQPVKELREEAASLTEISLATASAAQTSLERAEARLSALETTLHEHMADLARQVQMAIAALQGGNGPLPAAAQPAWPLDGVMRLHNQLREQPPPGALATTVPPATIAALPAIASDSALVERVQTLERTLDDERTARRQEAAESRASRRSWPLVAALIVTMAAAGAFGWWLQRQSAETAARAAAAEESSRRAADATNQRVADAQAAAARETAQARETAARAQLVSDVLAAPDLARILLRGGSPGNRYSGQLLWSRSRGLVFSTSRLPPPNDGTYQLWLTTLTQPVSVGVFSLDATGRVTLAMADPPRPAGAVVGALVTLEPGHGSDTPTGPTILSREP